MTDWSAHHHPHRNTLGWLAAATLAVLLAATTAALANWLNTRVGTGSSESTILLDLPPLPAAFAVSEPPIPQPVVPPAVSRTQTEPATTDPAPRPAADHDAPAELTRPDPPAMDDLPEAPPDSEATVPAPHKKPKIAKAPQDKADPAAKPRKAQPSGAAGAATAKGDGASASAMRKWAAKASQRLDRHMRRGRYDATGRATIRFQVAASGQITGAKLLGSTGNASLDAALLVQARRAPALPARPDGKSGQIDKPVNFGP